jgi:hypothetical protein
MPSLSFFHSTLVQYLPDKFNSVNRSEIETVPNEVFQSIEAAQAIEIIMEVISSVDIDRWIMCESFLNSQGFTVELSKDKMNATRGNDTIKITFDSQQRIAEIGGSLQPQLLAT